MILPIVLHGYEAWSLTLREGCRLRGCENRVLRRIFGPKGDEVTQDWRKLHNEELNDLNSSLNIVRIMLRVWGRGEVITGFWWGNLRERSRRGWEDNIKMGLPDVGSEGMDWIELAQDTDSWRAHVNVVMSFGVL
jgi:hypothetical protein